MPPVPPRLEFISTRSTERENRRRRRRRQFQAAVAVVFLAAVAVIAVELVRRHDDSTHASGSALSRNAAATGPADASHGSGSGSGATSRPSDPLNEKAMKRLVDARDGDITAAVEDLRTGQEWVLHPGQRHQTASIVKADILETLLDQAQKADTPLSEATSDVAQGMIEASDNDDATDLYDDIGGASGLAAYNARIGLRHTTPSEAWGETLTTAQDQIRLLDELAEPRTSILSKPSRAYQLDLMHQIETGENWGVTGGVPASGVKVALKNGWVPLTSGTDWEVNSIGWVHGDRHDYLIAVLTAHDPSETYGIDTIDAMSKLIYDALGPVPAKGTRTISS